MKAIDKRQVRKAAQRFLPVADNPTTIVADRLWQRLQDMNLSPGKVVDVGGDGAFIAARYPSAFTIAVDHALSVLQAASVCCRLLADAEALPLHEETIDLVWSNLCVEWTEPTIFFTEMARVLKPGGLLAFTALGMGTLAELRQVFAGENRVHDFNDMHDIGDCLLSCGFAEPIVESDRLKLTYTRAHEALYEPHNLGAACARVDRPRTLMGKQRFQRALADYTARYADASGRVVATYDVMVATAWRKRTAEHPITLHRL